MPPFLSVSGIGANAAQNLVKAREEGPFLSIEDLQKRSRVSSTVIEVFRSLGCLEGMPENNQLTFVLEKTNPYSLSENRDLFIDHAIYADC